MSAALSTSLESMTTSTFVVAQKICPKAPPGAIEPTNEITGYIVWGVIILFSLALIIGLGAIVAGRIFSMPHASKVGVVSLVVVFVAAVAYLVLPGMLDGILGSGCIS